jgi:hypothetical protein
MAGLLHRITYKQAALGSVAAATLLIAPGMIGKLHEPTPPAPPIAQESSTDLPATPPTPVDHSDKPDAFDIRAEAESRLRQSLKDGDSARLRHIIVSKLDNGGMVLCGEVYSKNGFGGYTGFKRFIASPVDDAPTLIEGETSTGMGEAVDRQMFEQAQAKFCSNPIEHFPS